MRWALLLAAGCAPAPAVKLAVGRHHLCVLREDGRIDCALWEHKYYLDEEAQVPRGTRWVDVAAGAGASCGLDEEGNATCWGEESVPWNGADGGPMYDAYEQIFGGADMFCGLRSDQTGYCWGNTAGKGQPPWWWRYERFSPNLLAPCAITVDHEVVCWGKKAEEVTAYEPEGAYVDVSSSRHHACALDEGGAITCWGSDEAGEVADVPERSDFVAVTVGLSHSCGLTDGGEAVCWGSDEWGQSSVPAGRRFTQLGAGDSSTCGLDAAGEVTCWGCNITDNWPHQCEGL